MKRVALTFDDGPNPPYTNQILDILKKEDIKATFFVCGANVARNPQIVRQIANDGHTIGNHSYYHRRMPSLLGTTYKEIIKTQLLINKLTTQKQKLFRPPWGHAPFWLKKKLVDDKFSIILYDFEGDWDLFKRNMTAENIFQKVLKKTKENSIILLHDGIESKASANKSQTVKALGKIIRGLKERGFEFVRPDQINEA